MSSGGDVSAEGHAIAAAGEAFGFLPLAALKAGPSTVYLGIVVGEVGDQWTVRASIEGVNELEAGECGSGCLILRSEPTTEGAYLLRALGWRSR
jgi:hypothetical protein